MFDYKQRPFSRTLTDEEYNRATNRLAEVFPHPPAGKPDSLESHNVESIPAE